MTKNEHIQRKLEELISEGDFYVLIKEISSSEEVEDTIDQLLARFDPETLVRVLARYCSLLHEEFNEEFDDYVDEKESDLAAAVAYAEKLAAIETARLRAKGRAR